MKKIKTICAACALAAMAACTSTTNGYIIKGEVDGFKDGDTLYLKELSHVDELPFDTAVVKDGKFVFEGSLEGPRGVLIVPQDGLGTIGLVIENGNNVTVKGVRKPIIEEDYQWANYDVTITGSPLTDLQKQKMAPREELEKIYESNHEKHKDISKQLGEARVTGNKAMMDSITQTDAYKALEKDENEFFAKVNETITKMILDNKDSWWGPYLMIANSNYFVPEDTVTFNQLSDEAKQSYYGKKVAEELFPESNAGKAVPTFTLHESEQGEKPLTLAQALEGKKYLIIDFWASWCGPCRKSIPLLKKLYGQYSDKGLQILSISIDKKVDEWKKACREEKLPWLSYRDNSGIDAMYKVQFIPALFIVDADGKLVAEKIAADELENKLGELFK